MKNEYIVKNINTRNIYDYVHLGGNNVIKFPVATISIYEESNTGCSRVSFSRCNLNKDSYSKRMGKMISESRMIKSFRVQEDCINWFHLSEEDETSLFNSIFTNSGIIHRNVVRMKQEDTGSFIRKYKNYILSSPSKRLF